MSALMSAIGAILLQKSEVARRRIFRENTKREATADSDSLMRSLASLYRNRPYSPENFSGPVQNDFCNKIGALADSLCSL